MLLKNSAPRKPGSARRAAAPLLAPGAGLHARFLSILPRITTHGRVYFRHLRVADREEAVQEMVALCWKWFLRLAERGKDATRFPSALATYAARGVRSGRRVCGHERARDALSPSAQRRHGFLVSTLPEVSTLSDSPLSEALADNTRTPPDEQCAFRLDFPAWRLTRAERDRRVIDELMAGEGTLDVAGRHGLSPGRVSQLRRELHDDWARFCGADE
jgi:hypothetical protein